LKQLLPIIALAVYALTSCSSSDNQRAERAETRESVESENQAAELSENNLLPNTRFGKSEIINSKFDPKLIFGVWTLSYDDPACNFEINEKSLLLCVYDGDGERLYRIIGDSIYLDNPALIFKGKILNAIKDTLIIHWQQNDTPETLLRWKD
jgi:hypothetical protein